MLNIAIILTLLLLPYWALLPLGISEEGRGRAGILLVFAFTAIGHFLKTTEMARMLPPQVPMRVPVIYATGVFEALAAVAILFPVSSRAAGVLLCLFLIAVLPSNIYAAVQRVDFGGHGLGPVYLLIRIPLQLLLIGWIYWFAVAEQASPAEGG